VKFSAKVLTVSTSAANDDRDDVSGDTLAELLTTAGYLVVERSVIPDGLDAVAAELMRMSESFSGLILTTGGTGFSPSDQTPEGTELVLERHAPGLAEVMRATNSLGRLSRGSAGTRGDTLIINLPGSPKAVKEHFGAIVDVLEHILDLMTGGHPH
jgi:molybdopterin adenylyltransferase